MVEVSFEAFSCESPSPTRPAVDQARFGEIEASPPHLVLVLGLAVLVGLVKFGIGHAGKRLDLLHRFFRVIRSAEGAKGIEHRPEVQNEPWAPELSAFAFPHFFTTNIAWRLGT